MSVLQEQSEGATTQGSLQQDIDIANVLNAVEKLGQFKTEEDKKMLEVPHMLLNGPLRSEHKSEKL